MLIIAQNVKCLRHSPKPSPSGRRRRSQDTLRSALPPPRPAGLPALGIENSYDTFWMFVLTESRRHRELMGHEKNFTGLHFWARGYCVSTVGLNEDEVRKYIREQEEDKKQGELEFK